MSMLCQVIVKKPLQPGEAWEIGAPEYIETGAPRGVVDFPACYGHRKRWVITQFTPEFCIELAEEIIRRERVAMEEAAEKIRSTGALAL